MAPGHLVISARRPSSPSISGVRLDDRNSKKDELLSRLGLDLAIDIAYFVLGQYYGCFVNHHRPTGEIVEYLEREVRQEVAD